MRQTISHRIVGPRLSRTVVLWLALLAGAPALAGQAAPAPAVMPKPGAGAEALRLLLEQANFWRAKGRPVEAGEAIGRALALQPDNATALSMQGQIQAEQGQDSAARATLARLKAAHPDDPAVATLTQSIRIGRIDPAALAEARRLAREGRPADAVKRYQAIFKGETPPPGLALEYYLTLGGTEGGFGTAQAALQTIADGNTQDSAAALALAQLETYHEDSRSDGIDRLQALTGRAEVAGVARQSLRQALLWLPEDDTSVPALERYLAQNPDDAKIKAKLEAAKASASVVVDEAGQARIAGFEALQAGKIDVAEAKFAFALERNPQDADAMGGMGLVRFRQKKVEEARRLLAAAAQLEPTWEQALKDASMTPAPGRAAPQRDYGAEIAARYRQVQTLTAAGRYAEAEQLLTRLVGDNGNEGTFLQLADIQTRAGRLAAAEASLRRAEALNPQDAAPKLGLAGLLEKKGQLKDAEAMLAGITPPTPAVQAARADLLRRLAETTPTPGLRAALLLQAVQLQPSDVWGRLALARLYLGQGRTAEADQLMRGVGDGPSPASDAVKAGLAWAQALGDVPRQLALIRTIPAAQRSDDMRETLARASFAAQLDDLLQTQPRSRVRNMLLAMAAQPDPSGIRVPEIVRALLRLGQKLTAREAVVIAQDAAHGLNDAQRIHYSGALLEAGYDSDAAILLRPVARSSLPAALQGGYDQLRNGLAIRKADQLNQQGDPTAAYATLLPRLQTQPQSPDLNLAMARVYQTDDRPREAAQISQGVLNANPTDPAIRRAAVDTAIAAGHLGDAEVLVRQGQAQAPDDPRTWLAAADLDRARDRPRAALDDLERARSLHTRQLQAAAALAAP